MPITLVPLDETSFAESILPDAEQLAGPGGKIVLVSVVAHRDEADDAERYLSNEAQSLQAKGLNVAVKVLVDGNIPQAIDQGVSELGAERKA